MSFNLENYEPVAERLGRFWKDYPNGRIETVDVSPKEPGTIRRSIAYVYRDINDVLPVANGHAEEIVAERGVNSSSASENCETSAIGRALSNWIYASDKMPRPSREEMTKVNNHAQTVKHTGKPAVDEWAKDVPQTMGQAIDVIEKNLKAAAVIPQAPDGEVCVHGEMKLWKPKNGGRGRYYCPAPKGSPDACSFRYEAE